MVQGVKVQFDFGSKPSVINLPFDQGTYVGDLEGMVLFYTIYLCSDNCPASG
jgi:hypothetical protein